MRTWKENEEEQLFYELYEKYKDVMYRTAFKVVKNDADAQDAVQNAMICILNKMDELPSQEEKRSAYVIVTAHHAAIDIYRANRKHLRLCSSIIEDIIQNGQRCGADPFKHAAMLEKKDYFLKMLKKLNEDYCGIIMLHYYHNYSMKQIGDMLGLTEKAAATKLYRARKALEKELGRQGLEVQRLEGFEVQEVHGTKVHELEAHKLEAHKLETHKLEAHKPEAHKLEIPELEF